MSDDVHRNETEYLIGYICSVRRQNTAQWMEGLIAAWNARAAATGDPQRITTHGDGLQVITPKDIAETRMEYRDTAT